MKRIVIALSLLLVAASDSPSAVVKYRQTVMKSLGAHMTAMSLVVKKEISSRNQLAAHAEAVHAVSAGINDLFPAPDKVRSAAKPEVWTHNADFKAASGKLEKESAVLAKLAVKRDWSAFDRQFRAVADACEACHERFRVRD